MLLSAKRKFNNVEKSESVTSENKRSKVVQNHNFSHVDENIPHNMQKDSTGVKTLVSGDLEQSVDALPEDNRVQKLSRRKRLNLKRVKVGSQVNVANESNESEGETQSYPKKKFQLFKTSSGLANTKVDGDEDTKESSGGNSQYILKCLAQHHNTDSILQSCPVCSNDISILESDTERNQHINECLDGINISSISKDTLAADDRKELEFCQICQRDISGYNTIQRQQHINRCCDNMEEILNKPKETQKQITCLICGKVFKTEKSRQSHLKKCAKKNNVSTTQLVQLNRLNENTGNEVNNQVSKDLTLKADLGCVKTEASKNSDVFTTTKRRRKAKPQNKKLDEDTQLALALSVSLQSSASEEILEKRHKKKQKRTETPALLLRSDIETKRVTEARAAAVLCHWADSDDEIQCTPALAPSALLRKYGGSAEKATRSVDAPEQLDTISEVSRPEDEFSEVICGKSRDGVMKDTMSNAGTESDTFEEDDVDKREKLGDFEESDEVLHIPKPTKCNDDEKYLTIDKQARLWRVASLCTGSVGECEYYVPNLLPKTTPRKKRIVNKSSVQTTDERTGHTVVTDKNAKQDSLLGDANQNDKITESQEKNIKLLVELVCEVESDDMQPDEDEREHIDGLEVTWLPSSGFCVAKGSQGQEESKIENVEKLVSDLSSMVGNPLLSDVNIIAKDKQNFHAHSFMLTTRCETLAKILYENRTSGSGGIKDTHVVTLVMDDIDVRAVHAVMTFIYTASFVPVNHCVMEDVKILVERLNLNCAIEEWNQLNENANKNREFLEDSVNDLHAEVPMSDKKGDLDILLKSLWDGEDNSEDIVEEEENKFGDSILDDDLEEMEIKIYTQKTPKKNQHSAEQRCVPLSVYNGNKERENRRNKVEEIVSQLNLDSDEDGVNCERSSDQLSVGESVAGLKCESVSADKEQSNVENMSCSLPLSAGSCSLLSETSPLDSNILEIKEDVGDISNDLDGWLVPETPRKPQSNSTSLFISHKSRIECESESGVVDDDHLFAHHFEKPRKQTELVEGRRKRLECCIPDDEHDTRARSCERELCSGDELTDGSQTSTATRLRSPKNRKVNKFNSQNSSSLLRSLSPSSPVEIVISPTSPKQSSFITPDRKNSFMGTEDSIVKDASELCNNELVAQNRAFMDVTVTANKSIAVDANGDSWLDLSISSSSQNIFSPVRNVRSNFDDASNFHHKQDIDCCDNQDVDYGTQDIDYDNQDIDSYDDGGFNCDIEDYLVLDTSTNCEDDALCMMAEREDEVTGQVEHVHKKSRTRKKQMKDIARAVDEKQNKSIGTNARQLKPQNPGTPMLDYSNMATPDLKNELKQYGVRPLPKRKMVVKLKEIYHYTHRDQVSSGSETDENDNERETIAEAKSSNLRKSQKSTTQAQVCEEEIVQDGTESSEDTAGSCSGEELSDDVDMLSQESSLDLSRKFKKFLERNHELYLKILKYEPVPLATVQEKFKDCGIKCSTEKLKDFFDEQCITFTEPRTTRTRRQRRRAKPKSQKNN